MNFNSRKVHNGRANIEHRRTSGQTRRDELQDPHLHQHTSRPGEVCHTYLKACSFTGRKHMEAFLGLAQDPHQTNTKCHQFDSQNCHRDQMNRRADYLRSIPRMIVAYVWPNMFVNVGCRVKLPSSHHPCPPLLKAGLASWLSF